MQRFHLVSLLHGVPGCHWPVVAPPRLAPAAGRRRKQRLLHRVRAVVRVQPPHADRPVYVSIALDRPVRAVSYSLSRVSDLIDLPDRRDRAPGPRRHCGGLPRGQHLPRAVPAPLQPALRRARRRWRPRPGCSTARRPAGGRAWTPFYYLSNPRACYTVQSICDSLGPSPLLRCPSSVIYRRGSATRKAGQRRRKSPW
jgi:glycerol-3-phosphate acyltransferase